MDERYCVFIMNNMQKWFKYMRKNKPPTDSMYVPEIGEGAQDKVLTANEDGTSSWKTLVAGEIPLSDDESICIMKDS